MVNNIQHLPKGIRRLQTSGIILMAAIHNQLHRDSLMFQQFFNPSNQNQIAWICLMAIDGPCER